MNTDRDPGSSCPWIGRALVVLLTVLHAGLAHAAAVRVDAVEAELIADVTEVRPGQPFRIGLRLRHDAHWHTYWRNPGDSGLPTRFEPVLPAGSSVGEIQWPAPSRIFIAPLANYGYEGEIALARRVAIPADFRESGIRVTAAASWLVCRDVCVPGEADLSLDLRVLAAAGDPPPSPHRGLFDSMARRTPGEPIAVDVALDDRRVSLRLPASALGGVTVPPEFFASREGLVAHAAAQRVYRLDNGDSRLEIELAADAVAPHERAAEGVVVAGNRVFATRVGRLAAIDPGRLVATIAGAPAGMPRVEGPSGAGARLLEAARGAATTPAGAGREAAGSAPRDMNASNAPGTDAPRTLWVAMAFAFIGGLILNLMPCVFPVIGLKILGFAGHGGGAGGLDASGRRRLRAQTLWFAAGVVMSFWALAAMLLALRAGGQAVGWGFQLQSPAFVAMMTLLFVGIGLNLSGVFEFGVTMTRLGGIGGAHGHPASTLAAGALAVLVATPCTAPFMGSAMGFTLGEPPEVALAVFTALGVGMAAPYVLLGAVPAWLRWLPRPGRWMQTLREALAFPMYAAAAWLAWVLGRQSDGDAVFAVAIAAVLLALSAWIWGRFVQGRVSGSRGLHATLSLAALLAAIAIAWPGESPAPPTRDAARSDAASAWMPWSAERVDAALAEGRPVFVDFTAAWCVTCQANKKLVLHRDPVVTEFARRRVATLQADWTRRDPSITAELARFGRNGVPLYLVYLPGRERPEVLPELLSSRVVLEALSP